MTSFGLVTVLQSVQRTIFKRPYLILSFIAVIAAVICNIMTSTTTMTTTTLPAPRHHDAGSMHVLNTWSLGAFGDPLNVDDQQHAAYDWNLSTEENYRAVNIPTIVDDNTDADNNENNSTEERLGFYGPFREIRQRLLDHKFHARYTKERQAVQDLILLSLLPNTIIHDATTPGRQCTAPTENWIVFTAGCYGAGKTHTIRKLYESGHFPLDGFVQVDPDEIRRRLPEFPVYIQRDADRAGEHTRKEAGMMAELLTNHALEKGQNVLVDGSLRDAEWYEQHFQHLRMTYPKLKIGIIHVTAPPEAVFERVKQRAKSTGRTVPTDALLRSMKEVPKAVKQLSKSVDLFLEVYNPPAVDDSTMPQPMGMDPSMIAGMFRQSCAAA